MRTLNRIGVAVLASYASVAFAQQPATPAPPPAWKQGMSAEQEKSPLHPFAGHVTGRPASELPMNKLKLPDGFKIEVWADGIPDANRGNRCSPVPLRRARVVLYRRHSQGRQSGCRHCPMCG